MLDINNIKIVKYSQEDIPQMMEVWNEVVDAGNAFPEIKPYTLDKAEKMFASQTYCGVAKDTSTGKIYGVYDQHPNLSGRSGHIANGSYAVSKDSRGLHIGEKLVLDSIQQAKKNGFRILQFNAVVKSNIHAIHLYERIGFERIGLIKGGFKNKSDQFEDMYIYAFYIS